jgi:sorting nexin-9/18/33
MATLPRTTKSTPSVAVLNLRPQSESDFDAGINTSAAWTEHLERASEIDAGFLSDEEPDNQDDDDEGRPARALYPFAGKAEFRELSVEAGDELEVMKEELADGWSLVKIGSGEVGLLPRTYYTVCPIFDPELPTI